MKSSPTASRKDTHEAYETFIIGLYSVNQALNTHDLLPFGFCSSVG